jgi:intracellular septation protein
MLYSVYLPPMLTRKFLISCLIEFGPITAFFLGTEFSNFFFGTTLLVIGTVISLVASAWLDGRIPTFSLISSIFVLIFGILTLQFHDVKWLVVEYTLYNGLFGVVLLVGHFLKKSFLKPLFKQMFHVSNHAWKILSFRWSLAFLVTAILNQIVWEYMGPMSWIVFRVVAAIGLAVFGFSQIFLTRKHREPGSSKWGLRI